jgi:hypothetical protein
MQAPPCLLPVQTRVLHLQEESQMSAKAKVSTRTFRRRTTATKNPANPAVRSVLEAVSAVEEPAPAAHEAPPAAQKGPPPATLTLRTQNNKTYELLLPMNFRAAASYWDYVVRNRVRWSQNPRAAKEMADRAIELLDEIGLEEAKRAEIVEAGVVEIDIPYSMESKGWEYRIFPWEFVLGSAIGQAQSPAAQKSSTPLIVVRHICCRLSESEGKRAPESFMVVESAPGELNEYSFDSERRLVESNLDPTFETKPNLKRVVCRPNPTLEQLAAAIGEGKPDVIHLAGVDAHQGRQMLSLDDTGEWDGYFLADAGGRPTASSAEELAKAIKGDPQGSETHHPILVSCNFYNSAARVAAMIAAESAMASIGFQDEVDDQAAETFFALLYFNWRILNWDLLRAFRLAIGQVDLGGAIAVLWSVRSLMADVRGGELGEDEQQVTQVQNAPSNLEEVDPDKVLEVKVEFKEAVNYSLLQNNENLFKEFSIRKHVDGKVSGVCVEVKLFVGGDTFPYSRLLDITGPKEDLKDIRFPLTSTLMRSIRESVNTVVSVKVTWNDKICHLRNWPVPRFRFSPS